MSGQANARPIDIEWISKVVKQLVEAGPPVMVRDDVAGRNVPVSAEIAASPDGFLPLLLACGDTVWLEASGRSLGLDLARDPQSVLGFRVKGAAPGPVAPLLLSVMHAMAEVARPDMLLINDLHGPWMAAQDRMGWQVKQAPAPAGPSAQLVNATSARPRSRDMRP
ncbi:MAG: hypothetical protein EON55_06850 [Alphaproteobacteria bacterium]|nr:MAG: hypothetical protein EON55_06850 [Alphaproteobacteria bacterium]